jgi:putative membrane protein
VAAYVVVLGSFAGLFPYPEISTDTVNLLSHAIAVVNTGALLLLVAGWRWIRRGEVDKHRAAMVGATALILGFLVMYLVKIGGGGEKEIVGATGLVYVAYIGMLAVHILLSVLAVPLVIHALVLGLTHSPSELRETIHPRVGRVAAATWILSLALGVITYLLLNHVYDYRFMGM